MTLEELGAVLQELEESRKTAVRELAAIKGRQERIEQLERDKDTLLQQYTEVAPEAVDVLAPEERHSVYKMLRLEVLVHPDETLEVSGAFGKDPTFSHRELVPAGQVYLIREPSPKGSREAVHEQHDDDRRSCQRCHLRVVEEVYGDGDLLPNTPGPDKSKYGRRADVALLLVQNASEVKELMA